MTMLTPTRETATVALLHVALLNGQVECAEDMLEAGSRHTSPLRVHRRCTLRSPQDPYLTLPTPLLNAGTARREGGGRVTDDYGKSAPTSPPATG